jgi:hypothetical protein
VKVRFGPTAIPVVVALAVVACSSDDSSADVSSVVIESDADEVIADTATDAPAATSSGTDEPGGDSTGAPTGQLTLDGETFELTFDAGDPNALCQSCPATRWW